MARPISIDPAQLRQRLQASGPASAQALAEATGVDRRTVQRALATLGNEIEQLGKTRNTRYAARRAIYGQSAPLPLARFGVNGIASPWASLTALHGGWRLSWVPPAMRPDWADQVHDHAGFCKGLPFFLADLRPQGFLGRAIARRLPATFGLPIDPRNWSDDHIVFFLREWGEDLPGNLVLGGTATARALNAGQENPVTPDTRASRYPAMAEAANAGEAAGSSIQGEQPKFTAWLQNAPAQTTAVVVKFTDRLGTPGGRRWADLLVAEAIASDVLTATSRSEAAASRAAVFDFNDRRFYELARFDRVGAHGRRGVVSLRALHDAGFTGRDTNDWSVAATGLHERGWISDSDLRTVRLRDYFGRLIGNTDMHFGNLSFFLDPELPLHLTPTYDMLPMLWAPRPGDAAPAAEFAPPAPMPDELDLWSEVAPLAEQFWQRVGADARISEDFRPHAGAALRAVRALRVRFG